MKKTWKQVNTIYQIYPRSFQDSNGDGVGDLRGIIQRLPYLKGEAYSLGVDAIWLSPFFPSPMADFGYDVSDYCNVDPLFGTLQDFDELIREAHARAIKVMIDFVPNHTSSQHPWFVASASSRDDPKRDYYVWRDPKPDGSPPNNWLSIFGGSAWQWDETTEQYYLHTFLKEQPDLNWDNPAVRREMQAVLEFWFRRGVDGIRADAVRWISKDKHLRNDPFNPSFVDEPEADPYAALLHVHSRFGPQLFNYLRGLTDVVEQYDDRIMIFEDYPDGVYTTRDQYLGFYNVNPAVSMPFNFEGIGREFTASSFRNFITEFQSFTNPAEHVPVYCFGNHDQPRLVSRLGDRQARLIAVLQATLPGLPVLYYGDELGMKNGIVPPDAEQDPLNRIKPGLGKGRDPERTPMQWDGGMYAGFSQAKPWLPLAGSYQTCNVAAQVNDASSFFALYKTLLNLRASSETLQQGSYRTLEPDNAHLFVFERVLHGERLQVVLNFSNRRRNYQASPGDRVITASNPAQLPKMTRKNVVKLRPYEAAIITNANPA
ncbi:alpha-amylase [Candidatus Saccharibacteria bacterium]|nr:MAG: alpha-amylase [Candidatus Saccharibacteria bacterium]